VARREGLAVSDSPGAATDASGRAVLDPTKNVLDLVEAAIKRQDDLRVAEAKHLREVAEIRARHAGELRELETARLNAIREVDIVAVQRAAEVATTQATTLANQVALSAEAMRTQVAAAAQAATTALAAALEPIQKDIADLRRAQYEAQGQKTQVVETQAVGAGSRQAFSLAIAAATFASSLFLGITGIVIALIVKG